MTTIDLDALKRLAEAATPGPWVRAWRTYASEPHADVMGHAGVTVAAGTIYNNAANTDFIAACDPHTILALIARLERAEKGMANIYVLSDPAGKLILETADASNQGCWGKSFAVVSAEVPGFEAKYWKRWEPSRRAAMRLGWIVIRCSLVPND